MTKVEARAIIESKFKRTANRNVAFFAHDQHLAEGNTLAAANCEAVHAALSDRLWSRFEFDWSRVALNPGGTLGRASAFLQTKAALVYKLAESRTEASELESDLLAELNVLWLEWAGYMVTESGLENAL